MFYRTFKISLKQIISESYELEQYLLNSVTKAKDFSPTRLALRFWTRNLACSKVLTVYSRLEVKGISLELPNLTMH